ALRLGRISAACLVLAACNTQFATYTGTPRTPEFAHSRVEQAPDGFRTAVCEDCTSRAWRGYRDLGSVDPSSEAAFAGLAKNFGAAYLGLAPDAVSFTALLPFKHDSKEVGTRSLFSEHGTVLAHSRLLGVVRAKGGASQVFVHITYEAIDGSGKIYATTGLSQSEAVANIRFANTARL